jgi:hypothetical protein
MLKRWLGYAVLLLWLLITVSGIPSQFQIALFDGQELLPSVVFKFALLAMLMLALVLLRGYLGPMRIMYLWWAFTAYLIIHALYLSIYKLYPIEYVIFSYNPYYFFILVFPLAFILRSAVPERAIVFCLITLFVPLSALGVYQAVSGDPLVATESVGDQFAVNAWDFQGQVRGFSLFQSAFEFGHYIALIGALAVCFALNGRWVTKLVGLGLLAVVIAAGFSTLTRASYIEIAMTMFAAYVFTRSSRDMLARLMRFLPLIYGLIGAFVIFLLPSIIATLTFDSILLSDRSLFVRFSEWSRVAEVLFNGEVVTTLFGTGIIQNQNFVIEDYYIIDNSFLAVWMQCGFVGLLLWLALMWELWRYVFSVSRAKSSYLTVAVAASWSTWVATSMLNTAVDPYASLLMLLLLGLEVKKAKVARPIGRPLTAGDQRQQPRRDHLPH